MTSQFFYKNIQDCLNKNVKKLKIGLNHFTNMINLTDEKKYTYKNSFSKQFSGKLINKLKCFLLNYDDFITSKIAETISFSRPSHLSNKFCRTSTFSFQGGLDFRSSTEYKSDVVFKFFWLFSLSSRSSKLGSLNALIRTIGRLCYSSVGFTIIFSISG